jgi:hypothetical protein
MPPKAPEPQVHLTLGSRYRIRSLASREAIIETVGTFRGVVGVGSIDAIAMEVAEGDMKGKLRVIPTHMVVAIDILEAAKKDEEPTDDVTMHYT